MENNCIFCKIANGEIPAATVYEDEDFRAILDLGPASKGHTLILPKKHAANLFELPEETAKKVLPFAKMLGARIEVGVHAVGLNVLKNNGVAAGLTVMHFHVHLIPRYKNDTVDVKWAQGTLTEDDKKEILGLF